jgi:hypothetical protein
MFHPLQQPGLVKLLQQAQHYQALLELAHSTLPDQLKPYLTAVTIEQACLICFTSDAHWASKLRYFEQPLLHTFGQQLPHLNITQIKFRVRPKMSNQPTNKRPIAPPSRAAGEAMQALSQQVKSDKLAQALIKLSRHAENRPD